MVMFILSVAFLLISIESVVLWQTGILKDYIGGFSFLIGIGGFIASLTAALISKMIRHGRSPQKVSNKTVSVYMLCGLISVNVLLFSLNNFMNLNITGEEIKATFLENTDDFSKVAEYLTGKAGDLICYIKEGQVVISDKYSNMPLVIEDSEIAKNIESIFKTHGFDEIVKNDREINFILHQVEKVNGYDNGIAYVRDYNGGSGLANQSYEWITGNWYYFFTGYV